MQNNLSIFSNISCFWKWNLGCNDHLNCWTQKKRQNCCWPKTVCMRAISACPWLLCSALCGAAVRHGAEVPLDLSVKRKSGSFSYSCVRFPDLWGVTLSHLVRGAALIPLLHNRFPLVKSWRSLCFISALCGNPYIQFWWTFSGVILKTILWD